MTAIGKISKINSELGYGFIQVAKLGDIFFSTETLFEGTVFSSLKINDNVRISVKETDRGLFAQALSPTQSERQPSVPAEAKI